MARIWPSVFLRSSEVSTHDMQAPIHAGPLLPKRSAGISGLALVALGLALLTGLTLGQLTLVGSGTFERAPGRSTDATHTGLEFYEAVDAYLASGQTGALRAVVHPEFIDHVGSQSAMTGLEALLDQLELLRALASESRLDVTPVPSSGELVQFAVLLPPRADATVFGLPVKQDDRFAFNDTLRVVDGRVVERWSDLQLPVTSTTIASEIWDPPAASQMLPAISRLTALSGSTMTLRVGTTHVILVESGTLTLTEIPRGTPGLPEFNMESTEISDTKPLVAPPGSVVVAGNSPYRITNEGSGVARALLIKIAGYDLSTNPPAYGASGTSQNDAGVQIETLSSAIALPNHKGAWTIEIGRATLATGARIPEHEVVGSELIFVEQGSLAADLGQCTDRCIQTVGGTGERASEHRVVRTGEGISASDSVTTEYRVTGEAPVTLLIVTVAPMG
jgi:hypothetical protein